MRKILFLLLVFVNGQMLHAQNGEPGSALSGAVRDADGRPVSGATVYLLKAADTALLRTVIADSGLFVFRQIPAGEYRVAVTSVGFKKYMSNVIQLNPAQELALPAVTMARTETNTLQEVTVVGRRPFIEQRIDRMVVNVEAMVTAAGTNAFELLEKLPGVGVDFDGNVSLKGRAGALVFIDGKPTQLSSSDLAGYLKSLPSSTIERVELISNPPARYDAAGSGGVINIVTKKIRQKGFNGSFNVSYGQGVYEKVNTSVGLNYRVDKVNYFANISASESKDYERAFKTRAYLDGASGGVDSRFEQKGYTRFDRTSYNLRAGADYYMNKSTTMGVVFNGSIRPSADRGGNTTYLLNRNFGLDSSVEFRNNSENRWRNSNFNFNLLRRFTKPGNELSLDADYATYRTGSDQTFDYVFFDAGHSPRGSSALLGELPRDINIYSANLGYSFTLGDFRMETGFKTSMVKTENQADYFKRVGNVLVPDYENTNTFLYDENINAAYLSANQAIKQFEWKAGLRVEHTSSRGHQLGNALKADSSFKRDYMNVFPTVYLAYRLDTLRKHRLGLSYGKRINRPSYQQLNPFLSFVDRYYQEAGNPFLNPQISHVVELTHTYKDFLNTSIFYDEVQNTFNRVIELKDSSTFVNRPGNIGKISNVGLLVTVDLNPVKNWSVFLYNEVGRKSVASVFNGINVDTSVFFYSFQVRNQITFKKGWSAELNGWISSRDFTGQFLVRPQGELSAGVQKRFKRSSLSLNARDLLYTRISRGTILNIPGVEATFDNRRDSRVVTVSFNYRFGKSNNKSRNRRSSSEDEQGRVN